MIIIIINNTIVVILIIVRDKVLLYIFIILKILKLQQYMGVFDPGGTTSLSNSK